MRGQRRLHRDLTTDALSLKFSLTLFEHHSKLAKKGRIAYYEYNLWGLNLSDKRVRQVITNGL